MIFYKIHFLSISMSILYFAKMAIINVISMYLIYSLYCRGSPRRVCFCGLYILPQRVLKNIFFPVLIMCPWKKVTEKNFLTKHKIMSPYIWGWGYLHNNGLLCCFPSIRLQSLQHVKTWNNFFFKSNILNPIKISLS